MLAASFTLRTICVSVSASEVLAVPPTNKSGLGFFEAAGRQQMQESNELVCPDGLPCLLFFLKHLVHVR